jgi:hypothetical protein
MSSQTPGAIKQKRYMDLKRANRRGRRRLATFARVVYLMELAWTQRLRYRGMTTT